MLKQYKIVTITHRHTNLNDLGKYVIQDAEGQELADRLANLKLQFGMSELMYLSTCNRVMYFFVSDSPINSNFTIPFFQAINPTLSETDLADVEEIVSLYSGEEAIRHLFEVAASIDSLVIGEREILRQLRDAFKQSKKWGITGDSIRLAMKQAVEAAKEVYAKTRIGEKPISVVSLAIQKILKAKLPKKANILLVGAGQTNTLVAKFLAKHKFQNVTVFNRSIEKAQALSKKFNGFAHTLEALEDYDQSFDAMIVCTGATKAIITPQLYKKLIGADNSEKLIIDLAIPNNVEPEVVENFTIRYIAIDDLRALAKENLAFREREIASVKSLLTRQLEAYHIHFQQRQIELAMKTVPNEIKAIKAHAINNVFQKELETLDDSARELIEKMMGYMEKRCISIPMQAAKNVIR